MGITEKLKKALMIFLQISNRISFFLVWLFFNNFFVDPEPCRPGVKIFFYCGYTL